MNISCSQALPSPPSPGQFIHFTVAAQRPRDELPGQLLEPILDPFCRSWPGRLQQVGRRHQGAISDEARPPKGYEDRTDDCNYRWIWQVESPPVDGTRS